MATKAEQESRDRRNQLEGAEIANGLTHPIQVLGHEKLKDIGKTGGDPDGADLQSHSQAVGAGAPGGALDFISFGPLRPGVYEVLLATADASDPTVYTAHGLHCHLANEDGNDPAAPDYTQLTEKLSGWPVVVTEGQPYWKVKLRAGQSHMVFTLIQTTNTVAVCIRRLI